MKRLFVAVAAFALAAGIASAQDFNAAVETFNNGAQTLESNKADALTQFKSALAQFEACTEDEAADMVAQCKKIIPQTILSIAKEQINADAKDLVPTAWSRKGAALLKAKDFAGAAAAFKAVVALTPEDGQSQLLYGQALMQAGDNDTAIEALKVAAANGKADQANKLLSNLFLKKGQALLKENKGADAIKAFEEANSYVENANAYKLIASANTKLGKTKAAIDAYKKYLEIDPNVKDAADVMFTIAATAQKAGDKATATEYYKKLSGTKYAEQAKAQLAALAK